MLNIIYVVAGVNMNVIILLLLALGVSADDVTTPRSDTWPEPSTVCLPEVFTIGLVKSNFTGYPEVGLSHLVTNCTIQRLPFATKTGHNNRKI